MTGRPGRGVGEDKKRTKHLSQRIATWSAAQLEKMCAHILSVNKQILFFFSPKAPDSSSLSSLQDLVYITLSSQNTLYLSLSLSQSRLLSPPRLCCSTLGTGPKTL